MTALSIRDPRKGFCMSSHDKSPQSPFEALLFKACFFGESKGCTFCLDHFFQTEETVDIQDTLHSRLAKNPGFPFSDCIHQVPAYMCPTGSTFASGTLLHIPIAHQGSLYNPCRIQPAIPGAGFIFIEDDWYTVHLPRCGKPHIDFDWARRPGSCSTCRGVSSAIANSRSSSFRRYSYIGRKNASELRITQFAMVALVMDAPYCFQSFS